MASYLHKLDPALILDIPLDKSKILKDLTRDSERFLVRSATGAASEDSQTRILPLAAQLSSTAVSQYVEKDLVPVLIDCDSPDAVVTQIENWHGNAKSMTDSTVSARLPRQKVKDLITMGSVNFIEASTRLKPNVNLAHRSANLVAGDDTRKVSQTGKGTLIGIIDSGIDVTHPAFQNSDGSTRIINYLDQVQDREFSQSDIDSGDASSAIDVEGHGTHVAGIAAGNGAGSENESLVGVAPEADLAIVKTTFDSVDIVSAIEHIFAIATSRNQPCVVNLSLGGHVGGHDGTTLLERTIDRLSGPGRIVVASAGNEGSDAIHAMTIFEPKPDMSNRWVADFRLTAREVPTTNGPIMAGLLTLEVWQQREDALTISLRSPSGQLFVVDDFGQKTLNSGTFIINSIRQSHQYSGDIVTRFQIITEPQSQWLGGWSLIVQEDGANGGVNIGTVHAWINDIEAGSFSSSIVRSHLVGMPATAFSVISVASYSSRSSWESQNPNTANEQFIADAVNLEDISFFSSMGPTRDGENKPDIAAPGQLLLAPLSKDTPEAILPPFLRLPNHDYVAQQGTSMAAPYVSGALALLLEKDSTIDWAEAKRRLIKSAKLDRNTQQCWNPRWGYGKIDVERLLTIEPD